MLVQTLIRCGATLALGAVLAGCGGPGGSRLFNECTWNRSGCMYEGSYEQGEAQYAEEEARRLNKQQQRRMP